MSAGEERRALLVVLFLRGGIDGLNLIVPHAEEEYYRLRPGIAIPRPSKRANKVGKTSLDLDGFFGLHPRAASLLEHFEGGRATAVSGVGHKKNSRSHFKEQDLWETAISSSDAKTAGWLNRHLEQVEGAGPLRAVALSNSLPRLLRGPAPALSIRSLGDVGAEGQGSHAAMTRALEARAEGDEMERAEKLWRDNARATLELMQEVAAAQADKIPSRVEYPDTYLAKRLSEVAKLRRAKLGLEVAVVDYGGWDTHQDQGAVEGRFGPRVEELSTAIDAFLRDVDDRLDEVLVLTLSEFGRTAFENGTGGTDHGWGNVALLCGGALRAQDPVRGEWPGLAPELLNKKRDLRITTDFRDILGEVLGHHLGHPDPAGLLGRKKLQPLGLV